MTRTFLATALAALTFGSPAFAETLSFDVQFNDTLMTAKPDALSVGDRVIINDALLQDGSEAGKAIGACTFVDIEVGLALCNVTFVLPAGTVSAQFVNSPPPEKNFALFGGTGAYAGKLGTGKLVEHGDETGTAEFIID